VGKGRAVSVSPSEIRHTTPVDEKVVRRVVARLGRVQIKLDPAADHRDLQATFAKIRDNRNRVTRAALVLLPKLAGLRGDLVRIDHVIDSEGAELIATDKASGVNADKRKAALKRILRDFYEARAQIRTEIHTIEEAVSLIKWLREELRCAFEEASRSLSTLEFDRRLIRNDP